MKDSENTIIQDYIAVFYNGSKSTKYHKSKFNTPQGRCLKEMITILMNNDIVGFQQKAKEVIEWKTKRK